MSITNDTAQSGFHVFWGEIAPCDHLLQIYATDEVFLEALEVFVCGGIRAGEAVIVIATAAHLGALNDRIIACGVDVDAARSQDQYIPLDAEATVSKILVGGMPDEELFKQLIKGLIARAGRNSRRVRVFGEMVAILWAEGLNGATVRLEHLWHEFCQQEGSSVFCAYPRIGFTQNFDASIKDICAAHNRVVPAGYPIQGNYSMPSDSRNGGRSDIPQIFNDLPAKARGLKAIIVEDEAIFAETLRELLQELGFIIVGVTGSGREAIECAKSIQPDFVLMDCQIKSDLNGPETAVVIQGLTDRPVPIVFLTAHKASDYPLIQAVAPYVYLRKPFSDADLKAILNDALRLRTEATH